jgi:hypothetical protein
LIHTLSLWLLIHLVYKPDMQIHRCIGPVLWFEWLQ